jgi:putative methionine-R-sulfoxide reductase with GAF domain
LATFFIPCTKEKKMERNHVLLEQIATILRSHDDRTKKAERITECIRQAGRYRWVGLYEADHQEIAVIAWSGPNAPAYPRFPVTQGLSGDAVRLGTTIVVGSVKEDPRYLTTFENTCSEIVVPIKDARTGQVVGTVDVESERQNAFEAQDRLLLEACAHHLSSLLE